MDGATPIADRLLYEEVLQTPGDIEEDGNAYSTVIDKTKFSSKSDNHVTRDNQVTETDGLGEKEDQKDTFWRNEEENTLLNNKDGKSQDVEIVEIEDTRSQTLLYNVTDHPPISLTLISGFQVRISLFHYRVLFYIIFSRFSGDSLAVIL